MMTCKVFIKFICNYEIVFWREIIFYVNLHSTRKLLNNINRNSKLIKNCILFPKNSHWKWWQLWSSPLMINDGKIGLKRVKMGSWWMAQLFLLLLFCICHFIVRNMLENTGNTMKSSFLTQQVHNIFAFLCFFS